MDFETYINIMFNRKNIARLLFKKYQHEPEVVITVIDNIAANNLIEFLELGIYFESEETLVLQTDKEERPENEIDFEE